MKQEFNIGDKVLIKTWETSFQDKEDIQNLAGELATITGILEKESTISGRVTFKYSLDISDRLFLSCNLQMIAKADDPYRDLILAMHKNHTELVMPAISDVTKAPYVCRRYQSNRQSLHVCYGRSRTTDLLHCCIDGYKVVRLCLAEYLFDQQFHMSFLDSVNKCFGTDFTNRDEADRYVWDDEEGTITKQYMELYPIDYNLRLIALQKLMNAGLAVVTPYASIVVPKERSVVELQAFVNDIFNTDLITATVVEAPVASKEEAEVSKTSVFS